VGCNSDVLDKDNCKLYSLTSEVGFNIREVKLLRGLSDYINQIDLEISRDDIVSLFSENGSFSLLIRDYFISKFNPNLDSDERSGKVEKLADSIEDYVRGVENSRLFNLTFRVVKSIVRTNYFLDRGSIAFKFYVKNFSHLLKGLQPNYEMFVSNSEFSGIHLRMSLVSRGGLRWSDRHKDYREEIKSLMITQEGKNSIIIPSGGKGGFVINRDKKDITPELFKSIYSKFIYNLLDLVDNKKKSQIIDNPSMVKYDGDDTYFVVAADKGTSAMSDVANQIAITKNFWLKDAFASGGSNGYSHKDLGITAKGAFRTLERFFIEKGINLYKHPLSVVGIGSMNGDVFGNGILLSEQFRLLGAISHREIFVDPEPDPKQAYQERKRLFNSNRGGWSNYNSQRISRGGGVFRRDAESITISPEMKKVFGIDADELSGSELVKVLLRAKVDILFNGGVGTYVKASTESHEEVGDSSNNSVRVDASELQAYSVCEGGNLGFTIRGRIEYSNGGGLINLDAIDNSAGVHISDREVNLKILLSTLKIKEEKASVVLRNVTSSIVNRVLESNFDQALGISLDEVRVGGTKTAFTKALHLLENSLPQFRREYFAIPEDDSFVFDRPILATMFSYAKIFLKEKIESSRLVEKFSYQEYLMSYFPEEIVNQYGYEILNHPLKNQIIATVVADHIINHQGLTFINFFQDLGESRFIQKVDSYLAIEDFIEADVVRKDIGNLDYNSLIEFDKKILTVGSHIDNIMK
jgi:glutamate dehydrogenase